MKQLFLLVLPVFLLSTSFSSVGAQDEEYGLVSYFSDDFDGRPTAYGDIYDKDRMTCAHKLHPYGTMLKITRLDTRKSVTVKVIDKGPYISGRVVELSRRAAELLGIINDDGRTEVKVEVVSRPGRESAVATSGARTPAPASTAKAPADNRPVNYETSAPASASRQAAAEPAPTATTTARSTEVAPAKATASASQPAPSRNALVGKDFDANDGLYKIAIEKPGKGDFGVQVGRYTTYENALQQVTQLQAQWFENILLSIKPGENGRTDFRVILGPFPTETAAQQYDTSLRRRYRINGFVVNLAELR